MTLAEQHTACPINCLHDDRVVSVCLLDEIDSTVKYSSIDHIKKRHEKIDRFSAMSLNITSDLMKVAKQRYRPEEIGVCVGNMMGGWSFGETELATLQSAGAGRISAFQATAWFPAAAQGELTIAQSLMGYSKTLSGGLGAGLEALIVACDAVTLKKARCMIVGSSESLNSHFSATGASDSKAEKIGEAACFFAMSDLRLTEHDVLVEVDLAHSSRFVDGLEFRLNGDSIRLNDSTPFYLTVHPLIVIGEHIQEMREDRTAVDNCLSFTTGHREFRISIQRAAEPHAPTESF